MKLFLKLASACIAILLLAVVVVINIIDPNDYKQQLQDQVQHSINRELVITGDLSWSLYPLLGFNIEEMTLYNSPEFTEKKLLRVNKSAVSINVIPLASGKLEVGEIILDGVEFNLITNKDGVSNLDNLQATNSAVKTEIPDEVEQQSESEPFTLSQLALSGIKITNTKIQIIDHQKDEHQVLTLNHIELSDFAAGKTTHFSLSSTLESSQIEAELALETDLFIDTALTTFTLTNLKINSKVISQALLGTNLLTSFNGGLTYQIKDQQLSIDAIKMNNALTGPLIQGDINIDASNIKVEKNNQLTLGNFAITSHLTGNSLENLQLETSLQSNLTANLQNKNVTIDKFEFKNTVSGKKLQGNVNLSFNQLNVSDFEKILIEQFKIVSELKGEMLSNQDLNANLTTDISYDLNQQRLSLSSIQSKLNNLNLDGEFSLKNQNIPVIRYKLTGNTWDLNPYLTDSPQADQETTINETEPQQQEPELEPDLSILTQLDIEGDLSLDGLLYKEITLGKISNHLTVKDGKAALKPLTAQLYDGALYIDAWLDEASGKNNYQAKTTIKEVALLPLLKAAAEMDLLSGKANINLTANGQGLTATKIQQGVNATGDFKILDGELYGINLSQELRIFKAKIKGQPLPTSASIKKTDFASLIGEFTVKEGIANNQKLLMLSPAMRLDGTGTADTIKQTIDYKLGVTPLSKSDEKTDYVNLSGITIPLLIEGTFTEPSFSLDTKNALKEQINANKERLKEKAKKALTDKLQGKSNDELKEEGEKLKSKFKSLFK